MGLEWFPKTPEEQAEYQRMRSEWQKYHQERHQPVSEDTSEPDEVDEFEEFDEFEDEDDEGFAVGAGRALLLLFLLTMAVYFLGFLSRFFKG